ncbi:MAG: prepilin-type N-terminal cleavage/methylation domain-containing protein [Phycisphaerales bacterium]|nr:prepilin-type N-terminal cleavage/methylation domain-containing protein [Phycisphaerales bacterium]
MMRPTTHERSRGLTLVELLISLIITAMVGTALAALLNAVAVATKTNIGTREIVIRTHAIDSRVALYTDTALALLDVRDDGNGLVIWLSDDRASGTVHGTEIRWLTYDPAENTLTVQYVEFPEGWSQMLKDLYDLEYVAASYADGDAWWTVLADYISPGYTGSTLLGDQLDGVDITFVGLDEYDADLLSLAYQFGEAGEDQVEILTVASMEDHLTPL